MKSSFKLSKTEKVFLITCLSSTIAFGSNFSVIAANGGYLNVSNPLILDDNYGVNTFNNYTAVNGSGGAIYCNDKITISGGKNSFNKNSATVQQAIMAGGGGGAIFSFELDIISGENNFSGNKSSGHGGAIFSTGKINISGGKNTFTNNESTINGGAIGSHMSVIEISDGENIFLGNQASNYGGAIYAPADLILTAKNHDITFKGNKHAKFYMNYTPNSIYMANMLGNNTVNFSAKEDKSIMFYDPIESSSLEWAHGMNIRINETTAGEVYKGTVAFYTHQSNVYGNTTVYNGTMALHDGASFGADITVGSFTLNNGATLSIGVDPDFDSTKISNINAETITFAEGSAINTMVPDETSAKLTKNTDYTILKLNGENIINDSSLLNGTEQTIASGPFDVYYDVEWTDLSTLNLHVNRINVNPEFDGSEAVGTPGSVELANPATTIIGERQDAIFHNLDNSTHRHLWVTPFYNFKQTDSAADFVGYKVKTPGVVLGYDIDIGKNSFLGVVLSSSWPDYHRDTTRAKGADFRFGIYGGTALNNNWELTYLATYGKVDLDQKRYIAGNYYSAKYNYNNLHLGIGIAKHIKLSEKSSIKPYLKYEHIKIDPNSYSETNSGEYALNFNGDSQNINIIRAGLDYKKHFSNNNYFTTGLFYLGQYGKTQSNATAYFLSDPDNTFRTYNVPESRDNLGLTVGAKLSINKSTDFHINFTSLMSSKSYSSNIDITFNYRF